MALIQKIPYPPTFLKRTPASPLKGSLYWRALGPAIVVSHNGPKNQNTCGVQADASFPVPTRLASGKCGSICEGRGRLRMISTAFDPVFSAPRKEVAGRPDPFLHGVLEFVRGGKSGQKRPRGSPGPQMVSRFSFRKTGVAVFS